MRATLLCLTAATFVVGIPQRPATQERIGQPSLLEAAAFFLTGKTPSGFDKLPNGLAGKHDPAERVLIQDGNPSACLVDLVGPPEAQGRYRFSELRNVTTRSFFDEARGTERHEIIIEGTGIKCPLPGSSKTCENRASLQASDPEQLQARLVSLSVVHEKYCIVRYL